MKKSTVIKISLEQAYRAIRLCMFCNIAVAMWGPTGIGKSDLVRKIVPKGWRLCDIRASDKEAPDFGGIPYPVETKVNGKTVKMVMYLMNGLLPFDTEEPCIILLDEFDRSSIEVLNAMLQIVLDRSINGHSLSPNARIIICGNGGMDSGTLPLTKAAAARICHLYIEDKSEGALKCWIDWAADNDCTPELISFARYKSNVFLDSDNDDDGELIDYGSPRRRTWVMADKLYRATKNPEFTMETADILLPVIAGCVGSAAGREQVGWYRVCDACPTIEEIKADPTGCRLPDGSDHLGIFFALGMTLARTAAEDSSLKSADAFSSYVARWPKEQARFAYTYMLRSQPKIATSKAYLSWEKSNQN